MRRNRTAYFRRRITEEQERTHTAMDKMTELMNRVKELEAERDRLAAEIARRDRYEGCDGCSTGDCPHDLTYECVQAQAEIIREREAFVTRQSAELHGVETERDRLAAIVERLPKTADGVPVVPGDEVFAPVIVGHANGKGQAGYGICPHTIITVPEHLSEPPSEWRASWGVASGRDGAMIDLSGDVDIGSTFSTRAAAEAAKGGE